MSSNKFAQLRDRLKEIISEEKIDQKEFASRLGISAGYASELLSGKKDKLSDSLAKLISLEFNVYYNWLLTGEGEKTTPSYVSERPCIEDFSFVSKFFAQPSGGPGSYVLSQDVEQQYAFKTSWLKKRCQPNQCGLFTVRGNSMLPSIGDGDLVLVDMSKKELRDIIDGQIYAFTEGDLMKVKRLVKKGSKIIALSDNKAEIPDPMEVDMEQFRLIGRVIWVGHEYKIE